MQEAQKADEQRCLVCGEVQRWSKQGWQLAGYTRLERRIIVANCKALGAWVCSIDCLYRLAEESGVGLVDFALASRLRMLGQED